MRMTAYNIILLALCRQRSHTVTHKTELHTVFFLESKLLTKSVTL